jgi:ADP-ribose pyrophosphatase YjhB (NUDIX family)
MSNTVGRGSDRTTGRYRDSSGRTLADYPRPSVAVDSAVLTLVAAQAGDLALAVLEVRRHNAPGWALPGTFLHPDERLIDAVRRSLRVKAGVAGLHPRQLRVFDDPQRDDRGWVLSVAHVDVLPADRLQGRHPGMRLASVDAPGRLPYGHGDIIRLAVEDLRARYAARPDPDGLLPREFTLRELRIVHEAVAGVPLQRDTFRRAIQDQLVATGTRSAGARGRPAELFTRD